MDEWKNVVFWSVLVIGTVALILGLGVIGMDCENKRRNTEKANYAECVKRAMDPRECRDVVRKPGRP